MNVWCSDHTPTSWWRHPTWEPKKRHQTKLVQQWSSLLLCGDLHNYESIKYQDCNCGLACRTQGQIQHCWSRLWQLWSVSYGFVRYGPQFRAHTDWALVCIDWCTHKITSSFSVLVHLFLVFIFTEAGLSSRIMKLCIQWRLFPTIRWSLFSCTVPSQLQIIWTVSNCADQLPEMCGGNENLAM